MRGAESRICASLHPGYGPKIISMLYDVTAPIARKIASGVAGASSGTGLSGARPWIASAMAEKTEIASISGGSPTAFER
jgi:hypothetical protein